MSDPADFVVYNMPGMLSRSVLKPDPANSERWVRDDAWYASVLEKMTVLFEFYRSRDLLRRPEALPGTAEVVLKFSDFTERGQRFIKSAASDRWLASFDRPGTRQKATDVSYLEKQLSKLE